MTGPLSRPPLSVCCVRGHACTACVAMRELGVVTNSGTKKENGSGKKEYSGRRPSWNFDFLYGAYLQSE